MKFLLNYIVFCQIFQDNNKNTEISLLVFWFMHFYKKYVPLAFCSQQLLFFGPNAHKVPLCFVSVFFLKSEISVININGNGDMCSSFSGKQLSSYYNTHLGLDQ